MMTIDEVDRALADWQARLRLIDDNLVSLETSPVCMLLEQAKDTGLDGTTRARVVPALDAMRELFSQRSLLDDTLARAADLRKGLNRLFPGDALKEIERVLRGPSIALPPVATPMARRGLLDAAETTTSISADQLLAAMVHSFEQARDAVAAVDEAWTRLTPQADQAAAEATRLEAQAKSLGQNATAPLSAVRAQLDATRSRIARDPLGATDDLATGVLARLDQLGKELAALGARHRQVCTDLERAHALLDDIRATHHDAGEARSRCVAETDAAAAPLIDQGRIDGLAQWLSTLDDTMTAGRWAAAGVGVTRWLTAGQELQHEEEALLHSCREPLDRRDELAGRLSARRQQAIVLQSRGRAPDAALDELAARAQGLLDQRPVPLDAAAAAVSAYEARLRSG